MYVAALVHFAVLGIEHAHFVKLLRALASVLEHSAHCGVAVYVGVFALYVVVAGFLESKLVERFN